MTNRFFCSQAGRQPAIKFQLTLSTAVLLCALSFPAPAHAGDAPGWMHALTNAPLPSHDDKTDAVLLYSEKNVTVVSPDKVKTVVRKAYKILRPDGREYGTAFVVFRSPGEKVNGIRGWCIPAQGKDFEVKDKDSAEASLPKVAGSELLTDVRVKVLSIPAPDPGNIVGYEYEVERNPLLLQDDWEFQETIPSRESHYSLQLPSGWEYRADWMNHSELKPTVAGSNQVQWTVTDIKALRKEDDMPPISGVAGHMIVSFFPPGGAGAKGFANWQQMGSWYIALEADRLAATPAIKDKVAGLTASAPTKIEKMQALAQFVQHDIRYVAIELGIGGWQPHAAADIFSHGYGDCKDKTTLLRAMLHEIGVESYRVDINTERGAVTPSTPAHTGFNHAITAIRVPDDVSDPRLVATVKDAKLGTLLFFDPTNELTPFGQISGGLQANYGLLVTPSGGELVQLPKQPTALNSIRRTGKLTLDADGNLRGEVQEVRLGDRAWAERWMLRRVTNDKDRIKPIENLLAGSLSNFTILKASVINLTHSDQPFGFNYSFEAANYAKNAGGLLLVRPRVLGVKSEAILETKEPRQYPVEFNGPVLDSDSFDITLPPGYEVDELPPPVDADFDFASYHSKIQVSGNVLGYSRTFEVKQLSVPVERTQDLKRFYRIIANDERNTAILKLSHQ
jgi:hypothetical protein